MSELDDLRREVRRLSDKDEIRDLFTALGQGMDAQDWDLLDTLWAEDAIFDHSGWKWEGMSEDVWKGRPSIMDKMREGVSKHFTSHHLMANERITLDGDKAKAIVYLHSVHVDDPNRLDDHGDHGAFYSSELVRTSQGWRIWRLAHTCVWTSGTYRAQGPLTKKDVAILKNHLR